MPGADAWLIGQGGAVRNPEPIGYKALSSEVNTALDRYRRAFGAGRVLYLLDRVRIL